MPGSATAKATVTAPGVPSAWRPVPRLRSARGLRLPPSRAVLLKGHRRAERTPPRYELTTFLPLLGLVMKTKNRICARSFGSALVRFSKCKARKAMAHSPTDASPARIFLQNARRCRHPSGLSVWLTKRLARWPLGERRRVRGHEPAADGKETQRDPRPHQETGHQDGRLPIYRRTGDVATHERPGGFSRRRRPGRGDWIRRFEHPRISSDP